MNAPAVLAPRSASAWRMPLTLLAAVLLLLVLLYRQTATEMVQIWSRNDTFAHGYLVLPLSLWMIWRRRAALRVLQPRAMPWMLLPLAALTLLWMLAELVSVNAAAQFAFVAMLVCTVPLLLGAALARQILFPLLFLFFAVPFGEFLLDPMMNWTADFVVAALRLSGIPVYREGLFFVIPTGNWSVIDECSGVRYLIASFMVGSLFAYLNYSSRLKRTLFMAFALLVPIVANWLRAYIIVMMGHLSNNRLATGVDHLLYGWVFFGIVIFLMFMIGMRWADPEEPQAQPEPQDGQDPEGTAAAAGPAAQAAAAALPGPPPWWGVTLAAVLLLLWPHGAVGNLESRERGAAAPQLELPASIADWAADEPPALAWSPEWRQPRLELKRGYRAGSDQVGLYLAYYRGQRQDSKLVSSLNAVVGMNDRRWNAVAVRSAGTSPDWPGAAYRETDILGPEGGPGGPAGAGRAYVVARSFYWVNGRFTGSEVVAKLATAWSRLSGQLDDGAAIVVYASADSFDKARARVQAFHALTDQPLRQALARSHAQR